MAILADIEHVIGGNRFEENIHIRGEVQAGSNNFRGWYSTPSASSYRYKMFTMFTIFRKKTFLSTNGRQ